ncbi:Stimate, partial [Symbiodinium pilosum]
MFTKFHDRAYDPGLHRLPAYYARVLLVIEVQLLLFFCCVGTLVVKKVKEGPRRTWFQFGLDSSKQFLGAGWIHVMNLLCATIMGNRMGEGDECEWYWLNIMLDTTLGVWVEYILLRVLTEALDSLLGEGAQDFRTGIYWRNGEFQVIMYVKQLVVWLCIVSFMKLAMVVLMILLAKPLTLAARTVLNPFLEKPELKLIIVMIATPMIMNAFQFWVTDNFIKKPEGDESQGFSAPMLGAVGGSSSGNHNSCASNELEQLRSESAVEAGLGASAPAPAA